MNLARIATVACALASAGPAIAAAPRTLQQALAEAYSNNPQLQAARAQLRATDEGVPQAQAGWRPTVIVTGAVGYAQGTFRQRSTASAISQGGEITFPNNRDLFNGNATLTQPLYRGGQTTAATHQANNTVYAQRARLLGTEQQVFLDTVNAFVGVIQARQLLALNINNEQVLARQLQATNDRFRVGEITRTDVAQAEAALAGARAQRQTSEGNVQTAYATYLRQIGEAPQQLTEPQPLHLPVKAENEAAQLASANNPAVIASLFDNAAAKDNIDLAFSQLMPQLSLQAQALRQDNSALAGSRIISAQVLLNASVPIYQGGAEYSRIRQARQQQQQQQRLVDDARRQAIQAATQSWQTLVAARSTIDSTRAQIRANEVALEGTQREAIVGSRTTLDVLNAEQALLNSRVTLVQNLTSLITASYSVAASIGRLTARDLQLNVPLYDDTAYYHAVRGRLFGTGDYATHQPGR